jgi:hypothetical protein
MGEGVTGSTVPRRQLGRHLRDLRSLARLTVRRAARELEWSEAKIWRIESGITGLRSLDVQAMCQIYGASGEMTEALMGLARETKAKGWWHSYGDVIPEFFDLYIGLEEAASHFSWYESDLVPGLLQTEQYARILIQEDNPDVDESEIERRVHVRMARQVLLTRVRARPTLDIALNESVLRHPVGGAPVLRRQLDRLTEVSDLDSVNLRIVPFSAGLHAGLVSGPFLVLRFPTNGDGRIVEPPTVYREGLTGALYLDKSHEVERHELAFLNIWDAALSENESAELVAQIARELEQ